MKSVFLHNIVEHNGVGRQREDNDQNRLYRERVGVKGVDILNKQ